METERERIEALQSEVLLLTKEVRRLQDESSLLAETLAAISGQMRLGEEKLRAFREGRASK